jgi:hypothetical protein
LLRIEILFLSISAPEVSSVMPGFMPGIHVLKGVDGRDKPGHDEKN